MLVDHWPLLGLRLRTARLELRLPDDDELAELADVAAHGVHEPDTQPFLTPWTEVSPAERARHVVLGHWRCRGRWTTQDWTLNLAVFDGGRPVGVQEIGAQQFATLREVRTASWLGLAFQRRGMGTEMRSAVLHLAFAGLGATDATSGSFVDNAASLGVSRRLGYEPDGISRDVLHGRAVVTQRMRLTRAAWESTERPAVAMSGVDACLPHFGIGVGTPVGVRGGDT